MALVSGFLLSKAPDIPWVLSTLSPDYVSAQAGLTKLESLDSLTADDVGFKEIAVLCSRGLIRKNSPEPVDWSSIDLISYKGSRGSYATRLGILTKMPVDFRMKNGQVLHWDLTPLREGIEELKNLDFSFWGNLLFGFGLQLYVAEFVASRIESRK